MKKFLLLILGILFSLSSAYSNNATQKGLIFEIPGEKLPDGSFSPRKIISIPKLESNLYLPRSVHIKTRSNLPLIKNKYAELSPQIQLSIKDFGSVKVRALFPEYSDMKKMSEDKIGVGRIYELQYTNPIDPYDACRELMKNPEIEYAFPIFVHQAFFTPNDPLINNQYYLTNTLAFQAWDVSLGDTTVKIAIIDSGIDYTHPDLQGNLADGKYDFVGNVTFSDIQNGNWKEDEDPNPSSTSNTHGTHVTGCANAVTNNGIGIASLGANCKYIPIKVGADNPNVGGIYRGYEAILYAAQKGAKVINCSWGGPGYSQVGQDIINQSTQLGSIVVVAAGNDGLDLNSYPQYPANYENVINVGATNQSDKAASFSNYGHSVTVYAPGQSIYSTIPNSRYTSYDGTSMSSPIVAGLAALVKSVFPHYSPKQVYHQIRSTADNFVNNQSDRPKFFGKINAYNALTYNNPKYPDRKIPGCEISSFSISGSDAITNYTRQTLKIKIKNYLAPTSNNFKVKIASYESNLRIYGTQFTVGVIGTLEENELSFDVELQSTNLWFSGYVDVLITFEDNNYIDYDLLKIPIKIKSENNYTEQFLVPASYSMSINHSHSPNIGAYWAVGSVYNFLGALYLQNSNGLNLIPLGNNKIQAVYAFSGSKAALAQNSPTNLPSVLITTNAGQNWSTKSLSTFMGTIKNIIFIDDNFGVAIGDPLNNRIAIATTSDGGSNWSAPENTLPTSTGEKVLTGSIFNYNNIVWFGTNVGKIYRSNDKGKNWYAYYVTNGGSIPYLAFKDENNGLAIYTKTDNSYAVARTTNSGVNWLTEVFNFNTIGLKPVYLYAPKGKNVYIVVFENGAVFISHNDGQSWKPILSRYTESVVSSSASISDNSVRVWMFGASNVATLDFPIPVANPTKKLAITANKLDFGGVALGQSKIERLTLQNNGNTKTFIDKLYFEGENASDFQVIVGTSESVDVGGTGIVRIRFTPKDTGTRDANLIIISDAEPYKIEFPVTGYGIGQTNASFITDLLEISFDSTFVGDQKEKNITITNNGKTILNLELSLNNDNFYILPFVNEFILDTTRSREITVGFRPQIEGNISGMLQIKDKLSGLIKSIQISGIGVNATSINDVIKITGIYPNPVGNNALCNIFSETNTNITAKILDITGKEIELIYKGKLYQGENLLHIPAENLSSGAYIIQIDDGKKVSNWKFIKK